MNNRFNFKQICLYSHCNNISSIPTGKIRGDFLFCVHDFLIGYRRKMDSIIKQLIT